MNIKSYLDTVNVSEGDRIRTNCPSCGAKNTFTIIKNDGVLVYNCFKLNCIRGMYGIGLTAAEIKAKMHGLSRPAPKEIERMEIPEYVVIPTKEHMLFHRYVSKWGLQDEDLMYDVKDRRCVFPIKHKGRIIDANGRALDGAIPKWYRYTGKANYYERHMGGTPKVAVVVEDVISAVAVAKMSHIYCGFAILGTSLNVTHAEILRQYDKVVVALDPDAWNKTLSFTRDLLSHGLPDVKALLLGDDLKYNRKEDFYKLKELVNADTRNT